MDFNFSFLLDIWTAMPIWKKAVLIYLVIVNIYGAIRMVIERKYHMHYMNQSSFFVLALPSILGGCLGVSIANNVTNLPDMISILYEGKYFTLRSKGRSLVRLNAIFFVIYTALLIVFRIIPGTDYIISLALQKPKMTIVFLAINAVAVFAAWLRRYQAYHTPLDTQAKTYKYFRKIYDLITLAGGATGTVLGKLLFNCKVYDPLHYHKVDDFVYGWGATFLAIIQCIGFYYLLIYI